MHCVRITRYVNVLMFFGEELKILKAIIGKSEKKFSKKCKVCSSKKERKYKIQLRIMRNTIIQRRMLRTLKSSL